MEPPSPDWYAENSDPLVVQRLSRFGFGTPAQVADDLVARHRVGITHLSMRVSWPGMPQDDILAGIEILGREVLPAVRRRTARPRPRNKTPPSP